MTSQSDFPTCPSARNAADWQHALVNQLELLDEICRSNNIKYTVAFGGLLGTVRHRGFIPWDNDIDIAVTESDYLRLRQLSTEGKLPNGYRIIDHTTDPAFPLPFGRFVNTNARDCTGAQAHHYTVYGGFIDIFTLYPISSDHTAQIETIERFQVWDELQCYRNRRGNYRTAGFCAKWGKLKAFEAEHGYEAALAHAEAEFRRMLTDNSNEWYMFNSGARWLGYPLVRQEWFEQTVRLPFDGIEVEAPTGYLQVLQTIYGGSWRLFPTGETFKPYGTANLNIPASVIQDDYLQFVDCAQAMERVQARKQAKIEVMKAFRAYNLARLDVFAELEASKLEAEARAHKRQIRTVAAQRDFYHRASFEQFKTLHTCTAPLVEMHQHPAMHHWHVALPLHPKLLSAALWSWYAVMPDYWTVAETIALHDEDTKRRAFEPSPANNELRRALAATADLYLAIDAHSIENVQQATAVLAEICPHGRHAAVGRAFVLLESDPHACARFVNSLVPQLQQDDYLAFARGQALCASGNAHDGGAVLAQLATHTRNGMLLEAITDTCTAMGIALAPQKTAGAPPAEPTAKAPALTLGRYNQLDIPKVKWQLFVFRKELARLKPLKKKLKAAQKQAEEHERWLDEHHGVWQRLSSNRFAVWEQVYPFKQAIINAANTGDGTTLQKLLNPYLTAVYTAMDNDNVGCCIDEQLLEIALPLIRAERGEEFATAFLAAIPPEHRESIDTLLMRNHVAHPYLAKG